METLTDVVQLDLVSLVAATLKEAARLTAAVEGLARGRPTHRRGRRAPRHEPAARRASQPARLPLRAEVTHEPDTPRASLRPGPDQAAQGPERRPRDLGTRTLAVLCAEVPDATEVVAVESAFAVPLADQATGAVLDRDLVGTLDLVERDADGRLVVVDLKTAARKYSDLQIEASLQLSIYSYATAINGLADETDLRLRFHVLTKTKQPELHRYWTTRDRAANVRLYRLAAEVLAAVEAGVFPPRVGWHCQDSPVRSRCWAWG